MTDSQPPALHLVAQLEELPHIRLTADTYEDEQRLRAWLDNPQTRRRLADALLDALEASAA